MDEYVHENEMFGVYVADEAVGPLWDGEVPYDLWYGVLNRNTGVTEFKTSSIGEAIIYAENTLRLLKNKPWEWADKAQQLAGSIRVVDPEDMN